MFFLPNLLMFIADLHIHSKYSRATSINADLDGYSKWAKIKGIDVLGTGDFTHPKWLKELKGKTFDLGNGLFEYEGTKFLLSAEVNNVFEFSGKIRKVHTVVLAPSFEAVEQFNDEIKKFGELESDGRPTLNMSLSELADVVSKLKDVYLIPAHCLPPHTLVHTVNGMKRIDEISESDRVLTHSGQFKKVVKTFKRRYEGKLYKIIPWCFGEGVAATPEHPFFAIKSVKNCSWIKGLCKPPCSQKSSCKKRHYEAYKAAWIQARHLEKGDFLVYPRITKVKDVSWIKLSNFVNSKETHGRMLLPKNARNWKNPIKKLIKVDKNFCLLVGYYLAEGYPIRNEAIGFSFGANEEEYAKEVILLMNKIFGITRFKIDKRRNQIAVVFFSHLLNAFFKKLFYRGGFRAWNKTIPSWMLLLPKEKLAEVLRGWWRGDVGYTVSRELMHGMKSISLKLGIIPSITIDTAENFNRRGKRFFGERKIFARRDTFIFSNLSFFEDDYGMLKEKCFKKSVNKIKGKHGWIDEHNVYLPIKEIKTLEYSGEVYNLEVKDDNSYVTEFAAVHNCWTPWFGIFGSKTGFDSVEEGFEGKTERVIALETGLSSDPAMNWMVSKIDKYSLVSNSDCHSPQKLGREANVFECEMSYQGIINAIKTRKGFVKTYEFYPEEGKYHYDGHRNCNVVMHPEEAIKHKNICPVCRRTLTIGVLHRVYELADRKYGFKPENAVPFQHIVPLQTVISKVLKKPETSLVVQGACDKIIQYFGNEFNVYEAKEDEIRLATSPDIADGILRVKRGEIKWKPGYDGVFGELILGEEKAEGETKKQKSLMDF